MVIARRLVRFTLGCDAAWRSALIDIEHGEAPDVWDLPWAFVATRAHAFFLPLAQRLDRRTAIGELDLAEEVASGNLRTLRQG